MKKILLAIILSSYSFSAFAATTYICVDKQGKLIAQAGKCKSGQTQLTTQNLAGYGLQGPQGAPGKDGVFNIATCRRVTNSCQIVVGGTCGVTCNKGEFVLQKSISGDVFSITGVISTRTYPNGVGGDILYGIVPTPNTQGNVTASAVCCPIS